MDNLTATLLVNPQVTSLTLEQSDRQITLTVRLRDNTEIKQTARLLTDQFNSVTQATDHAIYLMANKAAEYLR